MFTKGEAVGLPGAGHGRSEEEGEAGRREGAGQVGMAALVVREGRKHSGSVGQHPGEGCGSLQAVEVPQGPLCTSHAAV